MRLADAHIHLFQRGYHRPGQPPLFGDGELPAYEALRLAHGVEMALAIGYEADGVDPGNNAYLRDLSRSRSWLWTLAFAEAAAPLEPAAIEAFLEDGHAGLGIYALDRACANRCCDGRGDAGSCCNPARRSCRSIRGRRP